MFDVTEAYNYGADKDDLSNAGNVLQIHELNKSPISKHKRVLLVDDDHNLRNVISLALTRLGFEVVPFDNAYDAFDSFIRKDFDVVLTDIEMPGMNGWELASDVKTVSPKTPVILITGISEDEAKQGIKNGYADSVITKPFALNELQKSICSLLDIQACMMNK